MRTFIFTFICFLIVSIGKAEEARLIRFPHINGKQIVFSYAGDLYTVSDQGGTARKLTSDIGYEMFPRISPDGKYIAFTGQYDGNTEVFVIPSAGGIPRRLTYTATLNRDDLGDRMGPNNIVIGWTPDSKHILFRTRQFTFNDFYRTINDCSRRGRRSCRNPPQKREASHLIPRWEKTGLQLCIQRIPYLEKISGRYGRRHSDL